MARLVVATNEYLSSTPLCAAGDLLDESRLADAGLTLDQHHAPLPGGGQLDDLVQHR